MTKLNVGLAICLLFFSFAATYLKRRADQINDAVTLAVGKFPSQDPRVQAASLAVQISSSRIQLHGSLAAARTFILRPESVTKKPPETGIEKATEPHSAVSKIAPVTAELADKRIQHLLTQVIGSEEATELQILLDPQRHSLPDHVVVYQEAMSEWLKIRARWPQPIGGREFESITRVMGMPPRLVALLDPKLSAHVSHVKKGLTSQQINAGDAIKFLKDVPLVESARLHVYVQTDRGVLQAYQGDNRNSFERFMQWMRQKQNTNHYMDLQTLALVSHVNSPDIWQYLSTQAGMTRQDVSILRRLHAHAHWHRSQIDNSSESILDRLRSNPTFPTAEWAVDSDQKLGSGDKEHRSDLFASPNEDLADAVSGWLAKLVTAQAADQEEIYRRLLELEPNDRFRRQMRAFSGGFCPQLQTTQSLAAALDCRWATAADTTRLYRHATVTQRFRASPDDPDASAEAILVMCKNGLDTTSDAARFWLDQPRWPTPITEAWASGGRNAELAFCEALLGADLNDALPGVQQAMDVLGKVGGDSALVALDAIERHCDKKQAAKLDRFIRFCRSKIERRQAFNTEPR